MVRRLEVEILEGRCLPDATAFFSNGLLLVKGDNQGDNLNVLASAGQVQVTERGQSVPIRSQTAAPTLANLTQVVEVAGQGEGNTLATDSSLGRVATLLDAHLGTDSTLTPASGPVTLIGGHGTNNFVKATGAPGVIYGGDYRDSINHYVWNPGTGTDAVFGAGRYTDALIIGNNNNRGEVDALFADGVGGLVYSRQNLVPFQVYMEDVNRVVISPENATGTGTDTVTIGDLTGVDELRRVTVLGSAGGTTVDASQQHNDDVRVELVDPTGTGTLIPAPDNSFLAAYFAHGQHRHHDGIGQDDD